MHKPGLEAGVVQRRNGIPKAVELQREVPVVGDIGGGEVRERALAPDTAVEVDGAAKLQRIGRRHADARHARVDDEVVAGDAPGGRGGLSEGEREVGLVDGRHDVVLDERAHRLDGRLREHEDGGLHARRAQRDALGHRGDGELVGPAHAHRLGAAGGAVAIRVGLDHAHHAHAAREAALERRRVAANRREVDLDPRPPVVGADFLCHGRSFRARRRHTP